MPKKLMPKRKQILEAKTAWLTEKHFPKKGPVNPKEIADDNKIKVHYDDYNGDFEGLIVHKNGRFTIFIHNPPVNHLPATRLRFSFAHELGHFFIGTHRKELIRLGSLKKNHNNRFSCDPYLEKEADYFAANLLMPTPWLIQDFANKPFSMELITKVAKFYDVSLSATLNRYANLGPEPIMIINSINSTITCKAHPNCSKNFPYHKLQTGNTKQLPPNSLAAQLSTHQNFTGFHQKVIPASHWFTSTHTNIHQHQLIETCFQHETTKQITSILHTITTP
jgi:Zn-dependent peptidase ImmA (M78 family)